MNKAKELYQGKKVLILGLGLNQGGVGAAKFFAQAGAQVKVTDLKTKEQLQLSLDQLKDFPDIEYILGEHRFEDIDWADLIIRNPAIKPDNQYLKYALEKGKQVEIDMGIFLQFVDPSRITGVTGTKGKSTTASLIYEVLKQSGKNVVFAGNIQKSVLDVLASKGCTLRGYIVLELSSFQLQAFAQHQVSPKYSVITNIFPDHLNYHKSMEEYIEIKRTIAKYPSALQDVLLQGKDYLFTNKNDQITNQYNFLQGINREIILFSSKDLPQDFVPLLPGQHNLFNIAAALVVTNYLGIPKDQALKIMVKFPGIEYRLQLIKDVNGIKIYNDSASTTPDATIQALQSLPNSILIVGGMNKGLNYQQLAETIAKYAKAVYFLEGEATELIKTELIKKELQTISLIRGTYNNLFHVVKNVMQDASPGDIILFSPGATSFNLFQNEFDRGEKFNQAVEKAFQ